MGDYIYQQYERDLKIFLNNLQRYIDQKRTKHNVTDDHTIHVDGILRSTQTNIFTTEISIMPSTLIRHIHSDLTSDIIRLWKQSSSAFILKDVSANWNINNITIIVSSQYQEGVSLYNP